MTKYCYSRDGLEWRMVSADYAARPGEALFDRVPTARELSEAFAGHAAAANDEELKRQIEDLESRQTPRRIREAAAGTDGGWLDDLDARIATLRAQMGGKTSS